MHRQINALLSAGSTPGKLAEFGIALGSAGLDIAKIGGAEWDHDGPIALVLKQDGADEMRKFSRLCKTKKIPWLSFVIVSVRLDDTPGSLGKAAEKIGTDINIHGVLVLGTHGEQAVVGLGFAPDDADEAVRLLTLGGYWAEKHVHPGEPDAGIEWDQRTERLLPFFDDPNVPNDDPMFWESDD